MVTTAAGPQRVSVADGYRLVLESGPGMPFVTLKVERSAPGAFAADRAAADADVLGPPRPVGQAAADQHARRHRDRGPERTDDEGSSAIAFDSLFVAPADLLATACIAHQIDESRKVISMSECAPLRERLIDDVLACLKQVNL